MRNGKWFIGLFTAVLIFAATIFGKSEYSWDGTVEIRAQVTVQGQAEELVSWQKDRDDFYIFLPGYAQLSDVILSAQAPGAEIFLEGEPLEAGISCEGLVLETEYELCYRYRGKDHCYDLTVFQSADMPALYVDTASGNMDHIHKKKGNGESGTLRLYGADGALEYSGALETIKGRGNSTWEYEKKPYNLSLGEEADLLGMGAAKRWILLANAADASNLRNKLAYDLARDAGLAYSPECRWVDLYLNGEYAGLYLLSERNEIHEERVAIGQEGTFLVVKDWPWRFEETGDPYVVTEDNVALRIHNSSLSVGEVQSIFQSVENAILAEDGIDPVTGKHWRDLIDVDSWAKKYLLEEILGNVDANTLSQFYYYDGSGKVFAGPVWDMDLTLGGEHQDWREGKNLLYGVKDGVYGSRWIHGLYNHGEFYDRVTQLYETDYLPLLEELLDGGLEAYWEAVGQASRMNDRRWLDNDSQKSAEDLVTALSRRVEFLRRIWVEKEPYVIVTVAELDGSKTSFAHTPGQAIPQLPEYEDTRIRWYCYTTGTWLDPDLPVDRDLLIEAQLDKEG